jgi:hypothetical protein
MEDRESVDGGRYEGRRPMGEGMIIWGRKYFGVGHCISGLVYFVVLGVWYLGGFCESLQGAPSCWGLWAWGLGFLTIS